MAQAIVDPEQLRQFAAMLQRYSQQVRESTASLTQAQARLADSWRDQEHRKFVEEFEDQVELLPARGTLVLLHGHCWHRVRPVRGGSRVSTNYRCCPAGTPANVTDICVYRSMRYRFETNEVIEERSG